MAKKKKDPQTQSDDESDYERPQEEEKKKKKKKKADKVEENIEMKKPGEEVPEVEIKETKKAPSKTTFIIRPWLDSLGKREWVYSKNIAISIQIS